MEDLIKKIKAKGYWKIVIRPSEYQTNLIHSIAECKDLIKENKLQLRGWDYPHIDPRGIKVSSNNSVHSYCDWPDGPMYEYWRFYQTGQFVHYFSMREDLRIDEIRVNELQQSFGTKTRKFLDILSTLYSVTEVYQFAARLFSKINRVKGVEIIIELHDVKDRMLFFWGNHGRYLSMPYICEFTDGVLKVGEEKIIDLDTLLNDSSGLALDTTIEIFNKFNWEGANKNVFIEDQKGLLERRW